MTLVSGAPKQGSGGYSSKDRDRRTLTWQIIYSDLHWLQRLSILGNHCEEESSSLRVAMLWVGWHNGHIWFGGTVDSLFYLGLVFYIHLKAKAIVIPVSFLARTNLVFITGQELCHSSGDLSGNF